MKELTVKQLVKQLQQALEREHGEPWRVRQAPDRIEMFPDAGGLAIRCTMPDGRVGWWTSEKTWSMNPLDAKTYRQRSSASSALSNSVQRDLDGAAHLDKSDPDYAHGYWKFRARFSVVAKEISDLQKLAQLAKEAKGKPNGNCPVCDIPMRQVVPALPHMCADCEDKMIGPSPLTAGELL